MLPEGTMSSEEEMTIDERYKYLRKMQKRYHAVGNVEKGELLSEMERVVGLHRKSLVRLMRRELKRRVRGKQRGRIYGAEVADALRIIGESADYICAERLTPNLVWMAEGLSRHGEMEVTPELLKQLGSISVSTVRRIMERVRQDKPRLPRRGPRRANRIAREIPAKRIAWDESEAGHLETDLVHHCGQSASGQYIHTLQMVDVLTGWSERVATLGRSYMVMKDGFCRIMRRLPFEIREIHPDNGNEFLNGHMLRYWRGNIKGVEVSRSRPYQKNDNRFVEQKNSTLVRAYFGSERLDSAVQCLFINQIYDKMWLYYNFFQPVIRLRDKQYLPAENGGSHIKRLYDRPQTPFARLCATEAVSKERRQSLELLRDQTNPRQLRKEIYEMIDRLFTLPKATPGQTEDVSLTLTCPEDEAKEGCGYVDN